MALIDDLFKNALAERMTTLDVRERSLAGDFEGSVAAQWVKIDENGLGVVEYAGKKYKTVRLGDTTLPPGSPVQLTHANGIYFSDW